jgi:MarR family transcriptional regulator, 2-MHQ and catechol-resistance regulon repressor
MGIQQDIKQSKFRNEHQKATINILYTSSWLTEQMRSFLEEYDLTHQQYNVMRILRGSFPEPISTLEIRNRMLDKMSDASRIVDRLVAKGLAEKRGCQIDKRKVDVLISEKGKKLMKEMDAKTNEMDEIAANITEAEAKTLNKILDKLREKS